MRPPCDSIYPDNDAGEAVIRRSQILDSALYRQGVSPVFMALSRADQLKVGNRFVERLVARANPHDRLLGLRKLVDVVESGASFSELGIGDVADLLRDSLPASAVPIRNLVAAEAARLEHSQ